MRRRRVTGLTVAGLCVLALAAAALIAARPHRASRLLKARADAILFKKEKPEAGKAGKNAEAVVGAESRNPDSSADVEAYLTRAYPGTEIPIAATIAAQNGWASLNAASHSGGSWQLIGPSKATYPAVLDPFLFDGAPYVASGRVTAMAISPKCNHSGTCPIY